MGTNTKTVQTFLQSLKSRKLILAVVGAVIPFGNAVGWWTLDTNQVWQILTPLLAFIGVEGVADIKSR